MSRSVDHDIVIDAPAAAIFDVLADPRQHPLFDGSGTVRGMVSGPARLFLGARFGMRMRLGVPYVIRNEVVEFTEDRRIAWRHLGRHVWRYELEPVADDTTRVRETFDWAPAVAGALYPALGFPRRNSAAMVATLGRLKDLVEGRHRAATG